MPLERIGNTDVHAAVATLPDGAAMRWHFEVGDADRRTRHRLWTTTFSLSMDRAAPLEVYATHPDSVPHARVPTGTLIEHRAWSSAVFPRTKRDWWVYVPAQYRSDEPACVMVFQDGAAYVEYVPTVFDNLIARADMPVTVGVFVSPGEHERGASQVSFQVPGSPHPPDAGDAQRIYEYDFVPDQYARLLLEEILPEVGRTVSLREDGVSRAITGHSSGGACAFIVAWERPDAFGKVLSWCGSLASE